MITDKMLKAARFEVKDSLEAVNKFFYEKGWTDGLPIFPPTPERVEGMLQGTSWRPDEVVGLVPPKLREASIEKIAINAVMAGCLPKYMPVIIAAVEAMLDESFNLLGLQATTHPAAPLLIVNGPIARELDINSDYGLFGPGWWSNATIGRCIRLILLNIGGAAPGEIDKSTQGRPSKYTFCIAENEAASPWEPLHVEKGFSKETSTVTVWPVDNPYNINDHDSKRAANILKVVAATIANLGINQTGFPGCETYLVIGPEHAETIASDGWSKDDVKHFVYENARLPSYQMKMGGTYSLRKWPRWMETPDDNTMLPLVTDWRDVVIVVGGGRGKHSCFLPSMAVNRAVTRAIKP